MLDIKMRRSTKDINCLLRWLFLVFVVYCLLMPVTLVLMGVGGGIMYCFMSCFYQLRLTCKICCRHKSCCWGKERMPTGEARTDYQDLVNEIHKKA